ncbi:hypothetical protein Bca4012_043495 [Brassica carinata]
MSKDSKHPIGSVTSSVHNQITVPSLDQSSIFSLAKLVHLEKKNDCTLAGQASGLFTTPANSDASISRHTLAILTHRTQGNTREITSGTSFLTEAEYKGIANAVAETCFLRNLLLELHCPLGMATLVFCDNISSVYLSTNPMKHQHTKHIEIDLHFFREKVALGQVKFFHVSSTLQYVEIFSKGLPTLLLTDFRSSLTVRCANDLTAGG